MVTGQQDNLSLVEEMMRTAKPADEPGIFKKGGIIPDGNKDLPLSVTELKSAGYVYIYDTKTGEQSKVNRNMLRSKLQMTRPDGSFVFSLKQTVTPIRGTFKCLLHPEQPEREYYDTIGLPTCRKDNLTSIFQVERHMQKRHQQEWATIKAERDRKEKQEDRDFQRSLLGAAKGGGTPPSKPPANVAANEGTGPADAGQPTAKRTYKKHKHRAKKE